MSVKQVLFAFLRACDVLKLEWQAVGEPGVRRDMGGGELGQLEYKNTFTAAVCPVLRCD